MTFALILAAGSLPPEDQQINYPLPLIEIAGTPLIEQIITKCLKIQNVDILCALLQHDIRKYHLDQVVKILAPSSTIIPVQNPTAGAACTALLAIEHINCQRPVLVVNITDIVDIDYTDIICSFEQRKLDAGTVVFSSVHPRYSFVRLDKNEYVVEAAEKNPISRNATAGIYWFARGDLFIEAIQNMIRKDAHTDQRYYICPVFNELILKRACIGIYRITPNQYHPAKSLEQMRRYEHLLPPENRANHI